MGVGIQSLGTRGFVPKDMFGRILHHMAFLEGFCTNRSVHQGILHHWILHHRILYQGSCIKGPCRKDIASKDLASKDPASRDLASRDLESKGLMAGVCITGSCITDLASKALQVNCGGHVHGQACSNRSCIKGYDDRILHQRVFMNKCIKGFPSNGFCQRVFTLAFASNVIGDKDTTEISKRSLVYTNLILSFFVHRCVLATACGKCEPAGKLARIAIHQHVQQKEKHHLTAWLPLVAAAVFNGGSHALLAGACSVIGDWDSLCSC